MPAPEGYEDKLVRMQIHNAEFLCRACRRSLVVQWNHPNLEGAQVCPSCGKKMERQPSLQVRTILGVKLPHRICNCETCALETPHAG